MNCETIYTENNTHCAYFLKKNKRYCKMGLFQNYDYCPRHMHLEKPLKNLEKPDECSICLENFQDTDVPLKCGHWVHKSCIIKSGKNQCPICRFTIYLKPNEIKECKTYEQNYRTSSYPSIQYSTTTLGDTVDRYINALPHNLRHHIQDVGIDNIIDLNHIRPGIFENILIAYINESINTLN